MKWMVLVFGASACVAGITGSSTTPAGQTASTGAGTPPGGGAASAGEYRGDDAVWVVDVMSHSRADAEELIHAKGPHVNVVATGDTDPQFARDETVCEQTPSSGKIAPTGTITIKMCNTYKPMSGPPNLRGMPIEDAKKKAVATGFTGKIEVLEQYDFDQDCKAETVCRVSPDHWELNQERTMTLYINKRVKITAPD
jgi:beta-lactam-binding protein with PASTA domain